MIKIVYLMKNVYIQALYGRRFRINEPERASESGTAVRYCSQTNSYTQSI